MFCLVLAKSKELFPCISCFFLQHTEEEKDEEALEGGCDYKESLESDP